MRRLTRTLLMASVCALAMTGSAFALDVPAATPGIAPSGTAAPTVPVMPGTTAAGDSIKGKVDVPHDDSPCQQGCDCTQEQLARQAAEDAAKRELDAQEAAGKWKYNPLDEMACLESLLNGVSILPNIPSLSSIYNQIKSRICSAAQNAAYSAQNAAMNKVGLGGGGIGVGGVSLPGGVYIPGGGVNVGRGGTGVTLGGIDGSGPTVFDQNDVRRASDAIGRARSSAGTIFNGN